MLFVHFRPLKYANEEPLIQKTIEFDLIAINFDAIKCLSAVHMGDNSSDYAAAVQRPEWRMAPPPDT